jgi:hypothetical protein
MGRAPLPRRNPFKTINAKAQGRKDKETARIHIKIKQKEQILNAKALRRKDKEDKSTADYADKRGQKDLNKKNAKTAKIQKTCFSLGVLGVLLVKRDLPGKAGPTD